MTRWLGLWPALLVLAMLVAGTDARAQSCLFSATDIDFGTVDVLGGGATDSSGLITAQCFNVLGLISNLEITIHIGEGRGGATPSARQMTSGTTATDLNFQLYTDSARTQVLGSDYWTNGGSPITVSDANVLTLLNEQPIEIPFYGRVPGGQGAVAPGSYASLFDRDPIDVRVDYRTCTLLLLCTDHTETFTFEARAQVAPECLVTAGNLDFGTVGVLNGNIDSSSQIDVTCTRDTAYDLELNYGLFGTAPGGRRMQDGAANEVQYELYQDAARSNVWGEAADGADQVGAGGGGTQNYTVFGRVPPQTTPPPGAYSDTVVVTVTY